MFDANVTCRFTHIIKEVGPPFHGDTLEDSQHGKQDVIKLRDPVIGPLPVWFTFSAIRTEARWFGGSTWIVILDFIWEGKRQGILVRLGQVYKEFSLILNRRLHTSLQWNKCRMVTVLCISVHTHTQFPCSKYFKLFNVSVQTVADPCAEAFPIWIGASYKYVWIHSQYRVLLDILQEKNFQ